MFRKLKTSFLSALLITGVVGGLVGATIPTATTSAACGRFLTLPAWYEGYTDGNCKFTGPPSDQSGGSVSEEGLKQFIWKIALNIIEIILQLIAYIAVAFVIYGGFLYMTSSGSPERASQGLKTIINASVGLAIAVGAVAITNLIWAIVGGSTTNSYGIYTSQAVDVVRAAFQTAYFIAGAVAVIVIIMSGISYITSNGNPGAVSKAKSSLLYSVIGLIVVILANPITVFILERL